MRDDIAPLRRRRCLLLYLGTLAINSCLTKPPQYTAMENGADAGAVVDAPEQNGVDSVVDRRAVGTTGPPVPQSDAGAGTAAEVSRPIADGPQVSDSIDRAEVAGPACPFDDCALKATVVSAGAEYSCAVLSDRSAWCWGRDPFDQMRNRFGQGTPKPTPIPDLTGVTALGAGRAHLCALVAGGQVRCWGSNTALQTGHVANDGFFGPVTVSGVDGATGLATSPDHNCVLMTDGSVRCWGRASFLGGAASGDSATPLDVPGLSGVFSLAASGVSGYDTGHTCVLVAGGQGRCWGTNRFVQLGDGRQGSNGFGEDSLSPEPVIGLSGATALAIGAGHTCAVAGGKVLCWGNNTYGQLGNDTSGRPSFVVLEVPGLTGATALAAGTNHTCALVSGGQVFCWGLNAEGELGNGNSASSVLPTRVLGLIGTASIAAGGSHTCAVADGVVWCWGSNLRNQLGMSGLDRSLVPSRVTGR